MDLFQTTILALIQGLTEFLPISSSAHLILPASLLGWQDQGLIFDVGTHVGTLIAVVSYFRLELIKMTTAWISSFNGQHNQDSKLAWLIILATLPAIIVGLLINDVISQYGRSIILIAGTTLIFGALLGWADITRTERRCSDSMSIKDALIIGGAQAIALIPGTSRSGITITAALMLGFDRQSAARVSFLLSIPVILGAGVLKGAELYAQGESANLSMVLSGVLISAISAFLCIHLFLKWLDRIGMKPFVIYRMILGALLLAVWFTR